jgi:hypothetical protein
VNAPIGQILHRRKAQNFIEPPRQRGAREPDFAPEPVDCPWLFDPGMQQRQGSGYERIPQRAEPARPGAFGSLDIALDRLDEQELGQLAHDGVGPQMAGGNLLGSVLEGVPNPVRRAAVPNVEAQGGRQRAYDRIAVYALPAKIPANEAGFQGCIAERDRGELTIGGDAHDLFAGDGRQ